MKARCVIVLIIYFVFLLKLKAEEEKVLPKKEEIENYLKLASQKIANKQLEEALLILEKIIKISPENSNAIHLQGIVWLNYGNLTKSIQLFEKAYNLNPSYQIALDLANVYLLKGNWEKAEKLYTDLWNKYPKESKLLRNLIIVLFMQENYRKANKFFPEYFKLVNEDEEIKTMWGISLYKEGDIESALNIMLTLLHPSEKILLYIGDIYIKLGKVEEAEKYYDLVLKQNPFNVEAIIAKGKIYLWKEDLDSALEEFKKALEYSPVSRGVLLSIGLIYQSKGDWKNAIYYYEKVSKLYPLDLEAYEMLAFAYFVNENIKEAIDTAEKGLKLNKNYIPFHDLLGQIYFRLGNYDKAIKEYNEVLISQPNNIDVLLAVALIYKIQGKLDTVIEYYQQVLKNRPASGFVHQQLGEIYWLQGKLSESIEEFIIFSNSYPQNPYGHKELAVLYLYKGELNKALDEIDKALKLLPLNSEFLYWKAIIYRELNSLTEYLYFLTLAQSSATPQSSIYYYLSYLIFLEQDKKEESKQALEKAVSFSEPFLQAFLSLAEEEINAGNYLKALKNLKRYLESDPLSPYAKKLLHKLLKPK